MNESLRIDQPWPACDLERVGTCPYCGSQERVMAYKDVQDWSFYCAPGKWTYWDCKQCKAIYIDPRPTLETIGNAYDKYYTHVEYCEETILDKLKNQLKNKCYEIWYGLSKASSFQRLILSPLRSKIPAPFWMEALADIPANGCLVDVGCGDGSVLEWATKLGWDGIGLEIDPDAVISARGKGLQVIEGTYEKLSDFQERFDCVVCLHVIEHVHNPIDLLNRIKRVLKPNGVLIIAAPNASSSVRKAFQENWRGLEAPRHLGIPALTSLKSYLEVLGFENIHQFSNDNLTGVESSRIRRRDMSLSSIDKEEGLLKNMGGTTKGCDDIIQFVCRKSI